MHVGRRIKKIRKSKGLNIDLVAAAMKIGKQQYEHIEGRKTIQTQTLCKLSALFLGRLDDFFGYSPEFPFVLCGPKEMFPQRLKLAFCCSGMKTRDFLKETKIHRTSWESYLDGLALPKTDKLLLIAQVLGVSIDWLLVHEIKAMSNKILSLQEAKNWI